MSKCNSCSFCRSVPGDCHSSCSHPVFNDGNNAITTMMLIANQNPHSMEKLRQLTGLTFNSYSVESGWAMFPMNYDPIWVGGDCKFHAEIPVKTIE